jgi:hypothetical protein
LIARLGRKQCKTPSLATIFLSLFYFVFGTFFPLLFLTTQEHVKGYDQQLNKDSYGLKLNQTHKITDQNMANIFLGF